MSTNIYSDINFDAGEKSRSEVVFDHEAIRQSILTILTTRRGSRLFRPTFGSDIERILFDSINEQNRYRLKTEMIGAIEEWETRVTITKSDVVINYDLPGYVCDIEYYIPLLNISGNLNFALKSRL